MIAYAYSLKCTKLDILSLFVKLGMNKKDLPINVTSKRRREKGSRKSIDLSGC